MPTPSSAQHRLPGYFFEKLLNQAIRQFKKTITFSNTSFLNMQSGMMVSIYLLTLIHSCRSSANQNSHCHPNLLTHCSFVFSPLFSHNFLKILLLSPRNITICKISATPNYSPQGRYRHLPRTWPTCFQH